MINLEVLRGKGLIKIVGHKVADFDCMVSGYLLEYVLDKLGICSRYVITDGLIDIYFKEKAKEIGFEYEVCENLNEKDYLFLVDHTAHYDNKIVGCFDHHHVKQIEIDVNYVDLPQTCCAKIIYDWATSLGIKISKELTILTVYACYMDSLSFKSTKALEEDKVWCKEQIVKYGLDEKEVISFGYGLTRKGEDYLEYLRTGEKTYKLGDKNFKASYIVVEKENEDLELIRKTLQNELNDELIAWCFIINNVKDDYNRILLITKEYCLIQKVDKLLGRGKDIIPAVMEFLNAKNDGTVTRMLIDKKLQIATMESCTSGLIASNITDYEGASSILRGSSITYSNEAKIQAGVLEMIIKLYGVYSEETAEAMALNTRRNFASDIGVGITGSFGNVDPANKDSVAGVVYFDILSNINSNPIKLIYSNLDVSRKEMKQKTVDIVLAVLKLYVEKL